MDSKLTHETLVYELQSLLAAAALEGFIFRLSDSDVRKMDENTLREWREEVRAFLRLVRRVR